MGELRMTELRIIKIRRGDLWVKILGDMIGL